MFCAALSDRCDVVDFGVKMCDFWLFCESFSIESSNVEFLEWFW